MLFDFIHDFIIAEVNFFVKLKEDGFFINSWDKPEPNHATTTWNDK